MSLVFDRVDESKAQIHAMIVGVGDYPYLSGGRLFDYVGVVGSIANSRLGSPPISARELASWMIRNLGPSAAPRTKSSKTPPLGSLELLISQFPTEDYLPPAATAPIAVETAKLKNIRDAFKRWSQRCDKSKDNVALFYFCGHGLEHGLTLLLAEDFGADADCPWENCIDFTTTWYGMADCKAATQCYFLDACRSTPIELLKGNASKSTALKTTQTLKSPKRNAPIFKSAVLGQEAEAKTNAASPFAKALIQSFESVGAANYDGRKWHVSTGSLGLALQFLMERTKLRGGEAGVCAVGGESTFSAPLHELPNPVPVIAEVLCLPPIALKSAKLLLKRGNEVVKSRGPASAPWDLEVDAGTYDVEATFPVTGPYRDNKAVGLPFLPPFSKCEIPCEP